MGANFSVIKLFEFVNDVHIGIGSGVLGLILYISKGLQTDTFKKLFISGLTAYCLMYAFSSSDIVTISQQKAIFITGCDSGLGFSLAYHSCELGFTVIAGCLNLKSEGAIELQKCFPRKVYIVELNVTNIQSVKNAAISVETILSDNEPCELWALINNAGVMVFGEFEWLTDRLIKHQFEVNVLGTMYITKAFLPMLRKYSGRVINITSHCAKTTLPGLSVYGATKSALAAWNDGLRLEMKKYGVQFVNLIPGSFVQQSNIMARQNDNVFEMQSAMTEEQLNFYGDYFKEYNMYLSALSGCRRTRKIDDTNLYEAYEKSLLEKYPRPMYINESLKYKFYHILFRICPYRIRDWLVLYFIQMPKWERQKKIKNIADVIA